MDCEMGLLPDEKKKKAYIKPSDILIVNGAIPFYCDSSQHCYANR